MLCFFFGFWPHSKGFPRIVLFKGFGMVRAHLVNSRQVEGKIDLQLPSYGTKISRLRVIDARC